MNINKGLDQLKEKFADPHFQRNDGLSNQIGYYLVSYNPKDEMTIRYFVESIKGASDYHPIVVDLYDVLMQYLEEEYLLEEIGEVESDSGDEQVYKRMTTNWLGSKKMKRIIEMIDYGEHKPGDILILVGIGKAYPFLRLHALLECMGDTFRDIPVVSFYPGRYDGRQIILFNKFFDDNHYRSFELINLWEN